MSEPQRILDVDIDWAGERAEADAFAEHQRAERIDVDVWTGREIER